MLKVAAVVPPASKNLGNDFFSLGGIEAFKQTYAHVEKEIHYIINCTGFKFDSSIFDKSIIPENNGKIPLLKNNFESTNINNLYFSGVLMQYIGNKKSSSAFIHGFRYLIKSMVDMMMLNNHDVYFKTKIFDKLSDVANKIVKRTNNSSSLFQMFGVMVDIIIYDKDTNEFTYIEDVIYDYAKETFVKEHDNVLMLMLDYGKNYGGPLVHTHTLGKSSYVFGVYRAPGITPEDAHLSNFLHPLLLHYRNNKFGEIKHLCENLFTEFTNSSHLDGTIEILTKMKEESKPTVNSSK